MMLYIVLILVKEVLDIFVECIGSLGGVDRTADHFASHLEDSYCDCHSRIGFPSTSNILLRINASVQDFDEDSFFRCHAKSKIFHAFAQAWLIKHAKFTTFMLHEPSEFSFPFP
jgi:hypothetical protein